MRALGESLFNAEPARLGYNLSINHQLFDYAQSKSPIPNL